MEKNTFLIYNDIVEDLYKCSSYKDIGRRFLSRLRMLVPFSYASLLIHNNEHENDSFYLPEMYCLPDHFIEAEREYVQHSDEDPLLWIIHATETKSIKESNMLPDDKRLNSPIYNRCYKRFDIYDSIQCCIVYEHKLLAVISLFSTRADGAFSEDDLFYIKSMEGHLTQVAAQIDASREKTSRTGSSHDVPALSRKYGLTDRESQILTLIYEFKNNEEIAEELSIRENTIQKHMQNIFRKMNASSKWDLLRF